METHANTKFSQYLATTIATIALSGGACYEMPKEYDSKDFSADRMLSDYAIYEHNSQNPKLCTFSIDKPRFLISSLKYIRLTPPANVTFQGKPIALDRPSDVSNEKPTDTPTKFLCQNQLVEFVLTDNQGGKKIDKFDLRRAKPATTKISADRSIDLIIPFPDLPYPNDTNFQMSIEMATGKPYITAKGQPYVVDVVNTSKKFPNEIPQDSRPMFDRDLQTLIIPKQTLKELKGKAIKINLTAEVMLFTKYPDEGASFNSFKHKYELAPISIEFK